MTITERSTRLRSAAAGCRSSVEALETSNPPGPVACASATVVDVLVEVVVWGKQKDPLNRVNKITRLAVFMADLVAAALKPRGRSIGRFIQLDNVFFIILLHVRPTTTPKGSSLAGAKFRMLKSVGWQIVQSRKLGLLRAHVLRCSNQRTDLRSIWSGLRRV